jgi:plastocyanin
VLDVTASGIAFNTHALEVAADTPFGIAFKNEDPAGVSHDIDIRDADKKVLRDQQTIDGGTSATYPYEGLPAGTYTFICSIHPIPAMTGTLTVK